MGVVPESEFVAQLTSASAGSFHPASTAKVQKPPMPQPQAESQQSGGGDSRVIRVIENSLQISLSLGHRHGSHGRAGMYLLC